MNSYPDDYIVHNLPLVILTGLEPNSNAETPFGEKSFEFLGNGGFRVRAELPPLHHALAPHLRTALLSHDRSKAAWRSQSADKSDQNPPFKIRSVGRAYTFPPRKAPPPPHSPRLRPANDNGASPPPVTLHSTLSPLSPSSPLYPDGIISPLWITKHQHRLPSVLVSFYNLISDAGKSSLEDNKIKSEINTIRSLISSTNYKTKFVIVLVADGPINSSELEERLVNIRRGTNFDSKALYYLPSTSNAAEINDFAKVLFSTLHPTSIEYYRDLSKHARRKRSRNTVPQPTLPPTQGTSSTLSLQGWNVRYEFKLGIFAETRQELEAAARNYEQAYDGLFNAELFDAIPAWSPRFNEARMLADVIAIRLIRCALWSSQTTTAVRRWQKHQSRIQDLVDRRGKGSENYGWEAWQSIWSRVMADLVERSEVFNAAHSHLPPGHTLPVQILPTKLPSVQDRQHPWETLHHEGYWFTLLQKHIAARRTYAEDIPVEDRVSNANSAAQSNAKSNLYETYLTPEPAIECLMLERKGETYSKRILDSIGLALKHFQKRDQSRMVDELQYRAALEQQRSDEWSQVTRSLRPLWLQSNWRHQGWWLPLSRVGQDLLKAAVEADDHELCLLILWELAALQIPQQAKAPRVDSADVSTAVDLNTNLSQITASVAFASETGHVGEPVALQLCLIHLTNILSQNLQLKEVKIVFDGGINPILLNAADTLEDIDSIQGNQIHHLDVFEEAANSSKDSKRLSLSGGSYWSGKIPQISGSKHTSVYNFELVPREAGPVSIASLTLLLTNESKELTLTDTKLNEHDARWWEMRNGNAISRDFGMRRDVTSMTVLPKPPKANIMLPNLSLAYYTNENVALDVEITNNEDDEIDGELEARLITPGEHAAQLQWKHIDASSSTSDGEIKEVILTPIPFQNIAKLGTEKFCLVVSNLTDSVDHELELKVSYKINSDSANVLTRLEVFDLPVIRPFEASAFFHPRLHSTAWPDFFAAPDHIKQSQPQGLAQSYLVRADVGCFAQEKLTVRSLELNARRIVGGAICKSSTGKPHKTANNSNEKAQMPPDKTEQFFFDLEMQKTVLGDRSPIVVDFAIDIKWSRTNSEDVNTSTLFLPKFLAPMSEPRVLLQASKIDGAVSMYLLTYTIENPSMHFLTFNISMESGEGFAFSGPKLKSVSLVPISRYEVQYRVFMQKTNEWVDVHLDVLDAFFGQNLKVQPASDGVRLDKQGSIQVWSDS